VRAMDRRVEKVQEYFFNFLLPLQFWQETPPWR